MNGIINHEDYSHNSVNFTGNREIGLLGLRVFTLVVVISGLIMHLRSVRVFRWEQKVSGGVLVTYSVAVLGLIICSCGTVSGGLFFQVYLSSLGAILLGVNAFVLWQRWREADQLTHAVAELLDSLGIPIKKHLKIKIALSAIASIALLVDAIMTPIRS